MQLELLSQVSLVYGKTPFCPRCFRENAILNTLVSYSEFPATETALFS